MLTKSDFTTAIENALSEFPTIEPLYQINDPRVRQATDAMATMLAMLSAQIEAAQTEQFDKTRDCTVLADAAMRGIVPKGKACRVKIKATNEGDFAVRIETGRVLLDSNGLSWRVETAATVPAKGTATFEASQVSEETVSHTVSDTVPFYPIEVPKADDGSYLCSIRVSDATGEYEYRDQYTNTEPGERIYHVEADDRQRVFVRFGCKNVVGTQPENGTLITLKVLYTGGDITTELESPFAFEYTQNVNENRVSLSLQALVSAGEDPISMTVLHDIARYPAVYRRGAVFLGEFGFLVRSNFPNLQFLSVWNESMEEQVRGVNVANVNCLFVACLDESEKAIEAKGGDEVTEPEEITEQDWTETQKAIRKTIAKADDSYRVRFFTPVISKITVKVTASVASSYLATDVEAKIRECILTKYGKESAASRRGLQRPLYRDIYALIKENVPALSDGEADLQVVIDGGKTADVVRPEQWRFVAEDSLSVDVETTNVVTSSWGG